MMQSRRYGAWMALFALLGCQPAPAPTASSESDNAASPASTAQTNTAQPGAREPEKVDGYTVIKSKLSDGRETSVAVHAPPGLQVIRRPDPDPHGGSFSLSEALEGLPGKGTLTATIHTNMGTITCELFEEKAPNTVANFVGLARGRRKYWDTRENAWLARNYFDGTTFHRVIPGFMIQGGDYMGDGSGYTGYVIPDELHPSLKHDRPGQLCMANRGPNTNAAQFFITEVPTPHLDNSYTIFGQCAPVDLVFRIARVPQAGPSNRPITPVVMERVEISRGHGAQAAAPANAAPPTQGRPTPAPGPDEHVADKLGAQRQTSSPR